MSMARPKQTKQQAFSNNRAMDESESDDELATEQEQELVKKTTVKSKKPTAAESSTKAPLSRVPSGSTKVAKVKPKAKNETDMEVDSEDVSKHRSVDVQSLMEENERLSQSLRKLGARYDELQKACDELAAMKRPDRNEIKLQEAVDSMRNVVEKNNKLLDLRKSDYTKSRLINSNPSSAVEFVTMEWAQRLRNENTESADKEIAELRARLAKSETAQKEAEKTAEAARKEAADARRQLGALQKELDMEVANSKKLQAEVGRRPQAASSQIPIAAAASSSASREIIHELKKKIELYENITDMVIVTYMESIQQPGNVKTVTFTCLLTMNEKEFPFKLAIWDEAQSDDSDEREHVVYYPGEPVDPSIDLQYLASSFTFPRSQLSVFFQNVINVVSPPEVEEDE